MKLVTAEQMREIDRVAIEERGVPSLDLMENAGREIALATLEMFEPRSVLVLAGKGNNGGDGFVAARWLAENGTTVRVLLFADEGELRGDALENWKRLPGACETRAVDSCDGLVDEIRQFDVAIDALLGTGIRGAVRGVLGGVIEAANESRVPVIAADIPSGLPADGGGPEGPCIRAAATVTMGLPKVGMVLHPGPGFTGATRVVDIGFPPDLTRDEAISLSVSDPPAIASLLPDRPPDGHKGTFGTLLTIAGSIGMTGAAALTARSALRSGAGLVYIATPRELAPVYDALVVEAVKRLTPSEAGDRFDRASIEPLVEELGAADAVALGPGLSTGEDLAALVSVVCEKADCPLIIDADGLTLLSRNLDALKKREAPTVLTPHPGEMARLIGAGSKDVQRARIETARAFAKKYGVILALKGANTVVARPDGQAMINTSGNSGLAKGGSGDVLTGLIAGLAAQGMAAWDAARAGVFLHGYAADLAAKKLGARGMTPLDVIDRIPGAFLELEAVGGNRAY